MCLDSINIEINNTWYNLLLSRWRAWMILTLSISNGCHDPGLPRLDRQTHVFSRLQSHALDKDRLDFLPFLFPFSLYPFLSSFCFSIFDRRCLIRMFICSYFLALTLWQLHNPKSVGSTVDVCSSSYPCEAQAVGATEAIIATDSTVKPLLVAALLHHLYFMRMSR